jgi:hypothetical protein
MPETEAKTKRAWLWRRRAISPTEVLLALVLLAACASYAAGVPDTPPGFYIDESSISYNAHLIASTGRDEHGRRFPLFFRAFGEYKNPVHVYLLAAVFFFTGPSLLAARLLSAALGALAALALGLLGYRLTGRREVGWLTTLAALLTPWLFELSRLVFEVALYPLAMALYLLALWRAGRKPRWLWMDAAMIAACLALLTYTYSVGRLLAPLLALGLLVFARASGIWSVLRVWLIYALWLVPLLLFHLRRPDALWSRFAILTYVTPQSTLFESLREFATRYLSNLNLWRLLVTGDPETLIVSVNGAGQVLVVTFVLALAGAALVLRKGRREAFWLYVLYSLSVSPVPASLTKNDFHLLRLATVPVLLVVLAVPALEWLREEGAGRWRRAVFLLCVALTLLQGAAFRRLYHEAAHAPERRQKFDADYVQLILQPALAREQRPIYLADAPGIPGYIQAYWHSTLRGIPLGNFVRLGPAAPVPEGALFITTEYEFPRCRVLAATEPYTLCVATGPPRRTAPLSGAGFRAELWVTESPSALGRGERGRVVVRLKNASTVEWRAGERVAEPYRIGVGNRWLDAKGAVVVGDDGRGALRRDLAPGQETEITFTVNAPSRAGDYLLELDAIQEGVSWFGPRGSKTLRLPVNVR